MPTKFRDYTKAEWLAKVEKDLKEKPLDSLNWEVNGKTFSPFWHAEDLPLLPPPVLKPAKNTGVGLRVNAHQPVVANSIALAALSQGANEICFFYDWNILHESSVDFDNFEKTLLAGIHLDMVKVHFHAYSSAGDSITTHGSKIYHADAMQDDPLSTIPGALERALVQMAHFIDSDIYAKPFEVNFWVDTTNDYFHTIATFRAIRLCWQRVAEILPGFSPACTIYAHVSKRHGEDLHTAKIKSTAQATAALLGGADALFLDPFDDAATEVYHEESSQYNAEDNFGRRIALNIQHVLQLESYLDRVQDPAAGSYYIEVLTEAYAHHLWAVLQRLLVNLSPRTRLYKLLQADDPRLFTTSSNQESLK